MPRKQSTKILKEHCNSCKVKQISELRSCKIQFACPSFPCSPTQPFPLPLCKNINILVCLFFAEEPFSFIPQHEFALHMNQKYAVKETLFCWTFVSFVTEAGKCVLKWAMDCRSRKDCLTLLWRIRFSPCLCQKAPM